jgi:hypothetical protein
MTRGVAPDKIWAGPSEDDKGVFWDVGHWDADYDENCIEYIRKDISDVRIEELEEALKTARDYVSDFSTGLIWILRSDEKVLKRFDSDLPKEDLERINMVLGVLPND